MQGYLCNDVLHCATLLEMVTIATYVKSIFN